MNEENKFEIDLFNENMVQIKAICNYTNQRDNYIPKYQESLLLSKTLSTQKISLNQTPILMRSDNFESSNSNNKKVLEKKINNFILEDDEISMNNKVRRNINFNNLEVLKYVSIVDDNKLEISDKSVFNTPSVLNNAISERMNNQINPNKDSFPNKSIVQENRIEFKNKNLENSNQNILKINEDVVTKLAKDFENIIIERSNIHQQDNKVSKSEIKSEISLETRIEGNTMKNEVISKNSKKVELKQKIGKIPLNPNINMQRKPKTKFSEFTFKSIRNSNSFPKKTSLVMKNQFSLNLSKNTSKEKTNSLDKSKKQLKNINSSNFHSTGVKSIKELINLSFKKILETVDQKSHNQQELNLKIDNLNKTNRKTKNFISLNTMTLRTKSSKILNSLKIRNFSKDKNIKPKDLTNKMTRISTKNTYLTKNFTIGSSTTRNQFSKEKNKNSGIKEIMSSNTKNNTVTSKLDKENKENLQKTTHKNIVSSSIPKKISLKFPSDYKGFSKIKDLFKIR